MHRHAAGQVGQHGGRSQAGVTGELALVPPLMGSSQRLLNKSHCQVYYEVGLDIICAVSHFFTVFFCCIWLWPAAPSIIRHASSGRTLTPLHTSSFNTLHHFVFHHSAPLTQHSLPCRSQAAASVWIWLTVPWLALYC